MVTGAPANRCRRSPLVPARGCATLARAEGPPARLPPCLPPAAASLAAVRQLPPLFLRRRSCASAAAGKSIYSIFPTASPFCAGAAIEASGWRAYVITVRPFAPALIGTHVGGPSPPPPPSVGERSEFAGGWEIAAHPVSQGRSRVLE